MVCIATVFSINPKSANLTGCKAILTLSPPQAVKAKARPATPMATWAFGSPCSSCWALMSAGPPEIQGCGVRKP